MLVILLLATPAWGINLKLMSDFPSGGSGGGFGGGGVSYDFRDEFSDTLAAGSVNGTLSTSGHVRTVVDAGNGLSIAGGYLVLNANSVCAVVYPGYARSDVGRMLIYKANNRTNVEAVDFGWYAVANGTQSRDKFSLTAAGNISIVDIGATIVTGTYTANTPYSFAIPFRKTSGSMYLAKGGTEYPTWRLMYVGSAATNTPMYPTINNVNSTTNPAIDAIRIPSMRWLPTPLLSTRFGS